MTEKQKDALDKISSLALEFSKNEETKPASIVLNALCGSICAGQEYDLALHVASFAKAAYESIIRLQ